MRRRALLTGGGAVVVLLAIALASLNTGRLDHTMKDSSSAAIVAPHIDDSTAAITVPVPMVDTARLNARVEQKRVHDNLARVANTDATAMRGAIVRYAHAIESSDIAMLRSAYPAMSPQQQDNWEKTFFARADKIAAPIRYGATRITGDTAEADFTLLLSILTKDTKLSVSAPLKQHAKLARQGDSWQIVSLK